MTVLFVKLLPLNTGSGFKVGRVWGRHLCFSGLAPRGVTVAAQLPAATSLGYSCAWTLLFGSSKLVLCNVLLGQNSCIKVISPPLLLNVAVYFKSTSILATCIYRSLCESHEGLSCCFCYLQDVLIALRGSLSMDRDKDQLSDATIRTLHWFPVCRILD